MLPPKWPEADRSNMKFEDFFNICWDDILIPKIIRHLSLKELFQLRCVNKLCKELVEYALMHLKEVNLSGNNSQNIAAAFNAIAENTGNVEQLNLARCDWLTDDLLLAFFRTNTKLKLVNLNGNDSAVLTPAALQPLIIECKRLTTLKLSKCIWVTLGAVQALAYHQNLTEIDLSYCGAINERCICIMLHSFTNLQVLSLAYNDGNVTDNVMFVLSKNTKNLRHLNLIGCFEVTDRGIGALSLNCHNLESLMVRGCPQVTERSLTLLRGRVHIDRPKEIVQQRQLFLQV